MNWLQRLGLRLAGYDWRGVLRMNDHLWAKNEELTERLLELEGRRDVHKRPDEDVA